MKQPTLVLAFVAAAWLLLQPFLHWLIRWQIEEFSFMIAAAICAILALLVAHAAQRRHANWSATFGAMTVALNPFWPLPMPERGMAMVTIAAGVAAAIYAARRWK